MSVRAGKGALVLSLVVEFAAPALAAADAPLGAGVAAAGRESVLLEPQPEPWGGSTNTALVVGSGAFVPPNSAIAYGTISSNTTGISVFQNGGSLVDWWYQFHVPSGSLLQSVEIEACDTSATAGIQFGILRGVAPAGVASPISVLGDTGTAATPGCAFFSVTPTASTTINNSSSDYWVSYAFNGSGLTSTTQLHAIRIYYRLQVSPAPAVATFPTDVPTSHPFFRFVEAMAASGLTGGCASGQFCPDAPVTRGQLAVFLSTALGLHNVP